MAFSLQAVFGIDATGVRTELKQLGREIRSFASAAAMAVVTATAAAFVALSKSALDLAQALKNTSLNLGINVESLQALHYAAQQNGESTESMNKALEKLRLNTQAAFQGNKQFADALGTLHLTATQLVGLPLEQKYELIAKAYANSADKAAAYNAISELFGEKIGPKQIAVLDDLAVNGFPKTAKAAAAAGQVMSAQTVVALERASQAIEDFKKRATVAVGNIIVNFRTDEGLYLLFLQLRKFGELFVAKISDAVAEGGALIGSVFKGAFIGVLNVFGDGLIDVLKTTAGLLNKILPERFEINIGNLEALKSTGEGVSASIHRAISETKPSSFTKDVATAWEPIISAQKKVVDALNKVDLGPDAEKLMKGAEAIDAAGKSMAENINSALENFFGPLDKESKSMVQSGKDGGKAWSDAIKEGSAQSAEEQAAAAEKLRQAGLTVQEALVDAMVPWEEGQRRWSENIAKFSEVVKQMGGLMAGIRGGSVFNSLSDEALKEVVRKNTNKAQALQNESKVTGFMG